MLIQELSQPSDFVKINPPECVEIDYNGEHVFCSICHLDLSSYLGVTPRICIKPSVLLSRHIKKDGSWEPDNVNTILKVVQRFPEATFLGLTFTPFYIDLLNIDQFS